jgi:hypothetical protein
MGNNNLTDECLYPVVKYVLANHESKLKFFDLQNNHLSPYASRTILKAYSISPHRQFLVFKFGPLPLTIENMRAGFIADKDRENLAALSSVPMID